MAVLRQTAEPRPLEHAKIMADSDLAVEQVLPLLPCRGPGLAIHWKSLSHFCHLQTSKHRKAISSYYTSMQCEMEM